MKPICLKIRQLWPKIIVFRDFCAWCASHTDNIMIKNDKLVKADIFLLSDFSSDTYRKKWEMGSDLIILNHYMHIFLKGRTKILKLGKYPHSRGDQHHFA